MRSFSALVGVTLLASTFFSGSATASFSDDFNRSDSGTVGNGWVETESTGAIGISGNKLFFDQTDDLANRPMVEKTFTNYSSGVLEWIYTMDWNNNGEGTLAMYMQIGDSGSWTDPVTNQHTGIAASLRWSGAGCSASGECLAYRNNTPAYVDIQTVNTATEIKVTLDLDNDTFSIDVGNNGSEEVSDEGFTNGAQDIDAVRFFTDGLNDNNVLGRTFDDVSVQPEGSTSSAPMISQTGYIWENDDGSGADTNSQLAAGDTALTGVIAGSRLNLRTQIKNSGGTLDTDTQLGLFYDRGDGIWSRVQSARPASTAGGSGCDDSNFNCESLLTSNAENVYTSLAISPSGQPWMAFYDTNPNDLVIAKYVGSGGSGCANSTSWSCETVDGSNNVGESPSIAFDESGTAFVAYAKGSTNELKIAEYVGSGGNCDNTGGSDAWQCTVVETVPGGTIELSLSIGDAGVKWISYKENTNLNLKVATFTGSGSESSCATGSADWDCVTVDATNEPGSYTSIAVSHSGSPWVSHYDSNSDDLKIAHYVGSGGNCDDNGGSDAWECDVIDATDSIGSHSSIAFAPDGTAWVSYYDSTAGNLRIANYVASGGNCDTFGAGSDAWQCAVVDATGDVGKFTSLAFDPSGAAWIVYADATNNKVKTARYVGSNGNCDNTGGSDAWQCSILDSVTPTSTNASKWGLVFDIKGAAWMSYFDGSTYDVYGSEYSLTGEILVAPSYPNSSGVSLTESHSDMNSVTDTSNRDDADCIGGGTWNNGILSEHPSGAVSIPDGSSTAQCTEVTWSIDTSNAQQATTYRFAVATLDNVVTETWRGPTQIDEYPTLTIGSTAASTVRAAKQSAYNLAASCTGADEPDWVCDELETNNIGIFSPHDLAVDPSGKPWLVEARYTNTGPETYLQVYEYVGAGNGDCSNDAWECTKIESKNSLAHFFHPSMTFDDSGAPVISYGEDIGSNIIKLKFAKFVGSGGNCSGSSAWECTEILTLGDSTERNTIAVDQNGTPWISYEIDNGTIEGLGVAHYVGSGGSGCDTSAWNCILIDDDNGAADSNEIVFDQNNTPWIAYHHGSGDDLNVARYVGSGGSGCALPSWDCEKVEASGGTGRWLSIAIAPDNSPWIAYQYFDTFDLRIAKYVGGGNGSGCDTSSDWDCENVHTTNQPGSNHNSMAFDSEGNAWIATYESGVVDGLVLARYVGSGGSCTNSEWECEVVEDTAEDIGRFAHIAFDGSGRPWLSHHNFSMANLHIATLELPRNPPPTNTLHWYNGRSASGSIGQYLLTDGRSPISSDLGTCSATSGETGYCGIHQPDGVLESLASGTNARPTYVYALKADQNSTAPFSRVHFQTSGSPATYPVRFEIYRFGSTNGWEALSSRTTAGCSADNCVLEGTPSGTPSDYFDPDGSDYWVYVRVYQEQNASGSLNFNIDGLNIVPQKEWLRHGQTINEFRTNGVFGW